MTQDVVEVGKKEDWLTSIVKLATVVWSREECDQLALCKELVTILNYLQVAIGSVSSFSRQLNIEWNNSFLFPFSATLPGELCISSQSRVCEGTWPPPTKEIRLSKFSGEKLIKVNLTNNIRANLSNKVKFNFTNKNVNLKSHLCPKCEWNASVIFTPTHCVLKLGKMRYWLLFPW